MKETIVFIFVTILLVVVLAGSYFFARKYLPDFEAVSIENKNVLDVKPSVTIEQKDNTPSLVNSPVLLTLDSVKEPVVKGYSVSGKTVPNAEVIVNDVDSKADREGNFSVMVYLEDGENFLLVMVIDEFGNYSTKEVVVTYLP